MYEVTYDKPDVIKLGPITTSKKELKDIFKAWIIISLAFGIVMAGGYAAFSSLKIFSFFGISAVTVGIAFLLHELAHKIVAQRYNCWAEFRSFDNMLWFALAMSLFLPFVLAAPGAVMIIGTVTRDRNGKISLAGPLTNILLALVFLGVAIINIQFGIFAMQGTIAQLVNYGFTINVFLGAFNLLPVWNFDGKKILEWSKPIYAAIVVVTVILLASMIISSIIA